MEAERHVSLKPERRKRNEMAGLVVEVTKLAHRFPQPLGVVRTARKEVPWYIRDTRHPGGRLEEEGGGMRDRVQASNYNHN